MKKEVDSMWNKVYDFYKNAVIGDNDMMASDKISEEFINSWEKAKREGLIGELFPTEELIVKQPYTVALSKKQILEDYEKSLFYEKIMANLEINRVIISDEEIGEMHVPSFSTAERVIYRKRLKKVSDSVCSKQVQEDVSVRKEDGKIVKLQKGTKTSKLLRVLCKEEKNITETINIHSRLIADSEFQGDMCLSVHPLDFLTASMNKNGWCSCFNVAKYNWGCYCSSTATIAQSPTTIIAYVPSKTPVDYNGVEWNSKRLRVLIHVSNNMFHIGKFYPSEPMGMREALSKMVAEKLYGRELVEKTGVEEFEIDPVVENYYHDGIYSTHYFKEGLGKDVEVRIIEQSDLNCPSCGDQFSEDTGTPLCTSCFKGFSCSCCGESVSVDDHRTLDNGDIVCSYCFDDMYHWCDGCQDYHLIEDSVLTDTRRMNLSWNYARKNHNKQSFIESSSFFSSWGSYCELSMADARESICFFVAEDGKEYYVTPKVRDEMCFFGVKIEEICHRLKTFTVD